MQQLPLGVRLPDRAVFASFLPARNGQAVDHLRRAADGQIAGASWLCGPPGAGKTHLLRAVSAQASATMRTAYVPLKELARLGVGVLEGLRQLGVPAWRRGSLLLGSSSRASGRVAVGGGVGAPYEWVPRGCTGARHWSGADT